MATNNTNNAGRDQFIGNHNVSTGAGAINDYGGVFGNVSTGSGDNQDYGGVQGGVQNYGGVQGGVNSGSGSQTNIHAGDINANSGNVAVGSGINQSYSAVGAGADQKARTLSSALLTLGNSLFDRQDITNEQRNQVRNQLSIAIQSLRSGQIDPNVVGEALSNALYAFSSISVDTRSEQQQLSTAAANAGLNIG